MKILNQTVMALCLITLSQSFYSMSDQYACMSKPINDQVTAMQLLPGYQIFETKEDQIINEALNELINADKDLQGSYSVSPASPESTVWILKAPNGSLCGYVKHCPFNQKSAMIELIIIHHQHRGKGLAGILLSLVEKHWAQKSMKDLTLIVSLENHSALRAYTKYGFLQEEADNSLI